ncbi:MAG: translocation/assembly module TamB domain-containing protein [Bacteroidales bacterium]|nr:translocation/assembly module TamB domain-containing protein [Bacteroidales bacterium]
MKQEQDDRIDPHTATEPEQLDVQSEQPLDVQSEQPLDVQGEQPLGVQSEQPLDVQPEPLDEANVEQDNVQDNVMDDEPSESVRQKKAKKKRSPVSRFLRCICWLLFSPVILFVVLTALLYVPFVQDWLTGIACEKLSEETGMDVNVERLRVKFPLDIDLQGVSVLNKQDHADTLLAVKSCVVDLDLSRIFSWKVGVDALDLNDVVVDSHDLIASLKLRGRLKDFHLDVHNLELKESRVNITAARLDDCDLDIALQDTTIIDTTTSEPLMWMLNFRDIELKNTRVAFHTANDTMNVLAGVKAMTLETGSFDLGHNKLSLSRFELEADSVLYDMKYEPRQRGLDASHLALYDVQTTLPWLEFDLDATHLSTSLASLKVREKGSGLQLTNLSADVELDTTRLKVSNAKLQTASSQLTAWADMEWTAFSSSDPGHLDAGLSAQFSREDVLRFAGEYMPRQLSAQYPDKMLTAEVEVGGNLRHVDVKALRIVMPGMIDAKVSGSAGNLIDGGALSADLTWDIHTRDLSLVKRIAGISGVNLPPMDINGTTQINGKKYQADMLLRQGRGVAKVKGLFNGSNNTYQANARLDQFVLSNFLSMDSVCSITAVADVKGNGFDVFSRRTNIRAKLDMPRARYGSANIGNLNLTALLNQGDGVVNFYSGGDLVNADGCIELSLRDHKVDSAAFALDVRGLDLYTLGVTKRPFKASMSMHMLGNTNLADQHYVKGDVSAIQFALADTTLYPRDIALESLLTPDTTYAFLSAGDLLFSLNSPEGLSTLIGKSTELADSMARQVERRVFDRQQLISLMPTADLCVQSGQRNPLANILAKMYNITYREFDIDFHSNSTTGMHSDGYVYSVNPGSFVLDTITFALRQDTTGLNLNARVCNGKKNRGATFDSRLDAIVNPDKMALSLVFLDDRRRKAVDLGANLLFSPEALRLQLSTLHPILAYRHFTVNDDNFVELQKGGHLDADLNLLADDGTGLKLYSTPNDDAEQDLTASLNHFNVGELCKVLPYMPDISGLLHGDVHFVKTEDVSSFMADLTVENMHYEQCPMGDIGVNAAYMPNEDGSHYVDGFLTQDGNQVLSFNGQYSSEGATDNVDAQATLEQFPVSLANGFMGETVQLAGYLQGEMSVTGPTSALVFDGKIHNESLHIMSPLYSFNMAVDNDTINVSGSRMWLNRLIGRTTGSEPLTLDGSIDFRNLSHIQLDLSANAHNFELINARRNRKAAAYGKVFVDLDAHAKGSTSNLNVYGNLGILGNTNVTYVLLDSPITVEDEMSDLVTFCDFSDTLEVDEDEIVPPSNLNMSFNISIDQAAMVNCLLSEDGVNYVRVEGGGDLRMYYDDARGMQLYGRYNILQGAMTYSMMVVTLKDCYIQNGSYVEFSGDVGNPRLNISATERVNSSITENETPRSVAFDVGLKVSQTLDNMGLEFTLDAPEDMNVQNEIAQMTAEQRGRVAVTLMATGMYLVEGGANSGGLSTTNALNAFLQSQIAQITGKALNTIDLSLGVANNATATGSTTTDYSFRFAKRFWGNRISLIVGGKVSSGSEAVNTGQSIIDNVSIEYRLDKSATRYVTLFYDNSSESVLEGKIMEMGAGLVLRRKTDKLGELFIFRKKKTPPLTP